METPTPKTVHLAPAREGLLVAVPGRPRGQNRLAPEGEELVLDTYWRRRLRDGDVVEVKPPSRKRTRKLTLPTPDSLED